MISLKFTNKERGVAGKAIDIRLHGDNRNRLKTASMELQAWLNGFRGVKDVADALRPGKPEVRLSLREGVGALGITASDIAHEVRSALQGRTNLDVQLGRESHAVAESYTFLNIFETKGLEDLLLICFLVLFILLVRYLRGPGERS